MANQPVLRGRQEGVRVEHGQLLDAIRVAGNGPQKHLTPPSRQGVEDKDEPKSPEVSPGRLAHGGRVNFTLLVFGCIDAFDSENRRIFRHDIACRSPSLSLLRTAPNRTN